MINRVRIPGTYLMLVMLIALVCAAHAADKGTPSSVKPYHYTVRTGDTASQLAQRWGLPESMITKPGQPLKIGDVITIPLIARTKVRRGGTLSELGVRYGLPVETIAKFNRIPAPYHVRAGRVLLIPATK